jgi:hypothetical protein
MSASGDNRASNRVGPVLFVWSGEVASRPLESSDPKPALGPGRRIERASRTRLANALLEPSPVRMARAVALRTSISRSCQPSWPRRNVNTAGPECR